VSVYLARSRAPRSATAAALPRNDLATQSRRLPALSEADRLVRDRGRHLPVGLRDRLAAGFRRARTRLGLTGHSADDRRRNPPVRARTRDPAAGHRRAVYA